jgi:hypothetical protein
VVALGLILKHPHAEETSPAAYFRRLAGTSLFALATSKALILLRELGAAVIAQVVTVTTVTTGGAVENLYSVT